MARLPSHGLYGPQIRAGRALLGVTAVELAAMTRLAVNTVRRGERTEGLAPITAANAARIIESFERAGLVLLGGGEGYGVRFAPRRPGLQDGAEVTAGTECCGAMD